MHIRAATSSGSAFFELEIEIEDALRLSRLLAEFGSAADEHCGR
jgi:hypothetical protein